MLKVAYSDKSMVTYGHMLKDFCVDMQKDFYGRMLKDFCGRMQKDSDNFQGLYMQKVTYGHMCQVVLHHEYQVLVVKMRLDKSMVVLHL